MATANHTSWPENNARASAAQGAQTFRFKQSWRWYETQDFAVIAVSPGFQQESTTASFHTFNQALGTLTAVDFVIQSSFVSNFPLDYIASINTFGNSLISPSFSSAIFSVSFDDNANASLYKGDGVATFDVVFQLTDISPSNGFVLWSGALDSPGLTLVYDYIPTVTTTTTPVPGALPLFATGLGGLGLFGWRRKRKAQAV